MLSDIFYNLGIIDAINWLAERIGSADIWEQVVLLMLAGAIPFVESYLGSFLGILLGVPTAVAIPAAILGNLICTLGLVMATSKTRELTQSRRAGRSGASGGSPVTEATALPQSRSRRKIARQLDRFGVPGVALLGPIVLASQITAPALVALGANRRSVLIWTAISIIAWGLAFGLFGEVLIEWWGPSV